MALDPDILTTINIHVRGGFDERDDIIEILEDHCDPDAFDQDELEDALDAAIAAHEDSKAGWPAVTDCDKLDAAFAALARSGLIVLHNAGTTLSDGISDVSHIYHGLPDRESIVGYCFYQSQDLERAVEGHGLRLAFGATDSDNEQRDGPLVGQLVVDELRRAGFPVEWDGTLDQRICIPRIDWQRR